MAYCVKQLIGFGVKSDSYLWLDWSWWITWGAACGNVSVERSWEHGQQSRSLRQSTECSVVNLNVRSLTRRQKVFFRLSNLVPNTALQLLSINLYPYQATMHLLPPLPPKLSSAMFSAADMNNGTIASVLREGATQQFTLIVPNCPAGRITSFWCFKVPLIPLGQASSTRADFSFFKPPPHPPPLLICRVREYFVRQEYWLCTSRKAKQCGGHVVLRRHSSQAEFITLHWSHFADKILLEGPFPPFSIKLHVHHHYSGECMFLFCSRYLPSPIFKLFTDVETSAFYSCIS